MEQRSAVLSRNTHKKSRNTGEKVSYSSVYKLMGINKVINFLDTLRSKESNVNVFIGLQFL